VTTHIGVPRPSSPRRSAPGRQGLWLLAILAVVMLADQLTKWWAWRHVPWAVINTGSTWFLGATVAGWYSGNPSGAALDLASAQILSFGLFTLLRRVRPLPVLLPAALTISGWASNLGDRLGLHRLTAPGMPRGAIDFLRWQHNTYNLADGCIATGTLLLGAAFYWEHHRHSAAPTRAAPVGTSTGSRPWRRARGWAMLAAIIPALFGTAASLAATAADQHTTGASVSGPRTLTPAAVSTAQR
jgi:lipoprotein signal peptidase